MRLARLPFLALALLALTACPGRTGSTSAGPARAGTITPPAADTLEIGDVIEVKVYGEPELSGSHKIRSDGTISVPLAGRVELRHLTPEQAASAIGAAYSAGYLVNPQVNVTVTAFNSKKLYVMGAVANPGVFPYEQDMNVLRAVVMAGGFGPQASKNSVLVTRTVNGTEVRTEVAVDDIAQGKAKNFPLLPGDIVFVPTSIL